MVEQITAFKVSDGTVFESEEKAVTAEARVVLRRIVQNDGLVNVLLANPIGVFQALAPLASYLLARQESQVEELPMVAGQEQADHA